MNGEDAALLQADLRGLVLFDKIGCRNCHIDAALSTAGTEKPLGTYRIFPVFWDGNPNLEKYDLLLEERPVRFRVPCLRNVALTAPYFHNGSVSDLEEAIRVMAVSQLGRTLTDDPLADIHIVAASAEDTVPGRNTDMLINRAVSRQEVSDIGEFLRSLTVATLPD